MSWEFWLTDLVISRLSLVLLPFFLLGFSHFNVRARLVMCKTSSTWHDIAGASQPKCSVIHEDCGVEKQQPREIFHLY